ncbi:MAG: hypothetical protein GC190_11460 [Alphaproteobacteria bacterium]|nr:hypothetical protein [Alphaproteobacteria bacterium]
MRAIIVFVLVLAVTVVVGIAAHSLFVMHAWTMAAVQASGAVPAPPSMADHIDWITHDIVGMGPTYGALVGIALIIAFIVAGYFARLTGLRVIVFAVAGAVAMYVLFTIMKLTLGTVGVFGARGAEGLAAQAAVGALAGFLFAVMKPAAR